jgi:hypothetical protein
MTLTRVADLAAPQQFPGPRTRRRRRRLAAGYGVVAALGFLLAWAAGPHPLRVFGLGLTLPGAGFLAMLDGGPWLITAHLMLAMGSVVLFAAAVIVWWWCGNVLLAPAVWVAAAAAAAGMSGAHEMHTIPLASGVVVALLVVATVLGVVLRIIGARRIRVRRDVNHAALQQSSCTGVGATPRPTVAGSVELSSQDLAALRFALDRGLQPVGEFGGFHFGDQWQLSATRYQVFTLGWALALATHNALPSMRGYLQQAQLNLIDKTRDPRLWSYWKWENAWGNLRLGADPLAYDNVMFSGYLSKQIGLYQAATGDLRHDLVGAYTLQNNRGRSYAYDFPTIIGLLRGQFEASDLCLWPCEPNWVYVFCNTTAGIALRAYDAAHGSHHWDEIAERFDRLINDEFTDPAGDITELKSTYTGISPSITNGPGTNLNAATGLHPLTPDRAQKLYRISRPRLVAQAGDGLRLHTAAPDFDPGNMKRSPGYALGVHLHAAREFGDDEFAATVCEAIAARMTTSSDDGVLTYDSASVWAHALLLMGRIGTADGLRSLTTRGVPKHIRQGPVLAEARYPDVLAARAVSDGAALDLVLHPTRGAGRHRIGLAQLHPHGRYRVLQPRGTDHDLLADDHGRLSIEVELTGRTPIRIAPQEHST